MATTLKSISEPNTSILIVDDNPQYTIVLKKILESGFGYRNIRTTDCIDRGYELIATSPQEFSLVFVDYRFPSGKTGGQLLEKLQGAGLLRDRIVFLITSEPSVDIMKQATAAGAIGVVAKPFDREELKRQLEKAERLLKSDSAESF